MAALDFFSTLFQTPALRIGLNVLDVVIVAALFYWLYLVIADTRGFAVLQGLVIIVIVTAIARFLDLQTLYWILEKALGVVLIAIVVLFQAEIKRALVLLGQQLPWKRNYSVGADDIVKIINAAYALSKKGFGALIVVQRKIALQGIIERAVKLDAEISSELLETVFYSHNPLHDGAAIIDRNRIVAASAYLPLTESEGKNKARRLGTRHRAALGISEQSDATVIVVSEETGAVSIAVNGKLEYNVGREAIGLRLEALLGGESEKK